MTLPLWGGPPHDTDPGLAAVEAEIGRLDPVGSRVAGVLRESFDQLLDGRRRGRWSYTDLVKTEKTHMGTVVEIEPGSEFQWDADDADPTDYRIADVPVDCWVIRTATRRPPRPSPFPRRRRASSSPRESCATGRRTSGPRRSAGAGRGWRGRATASSPRPAWHGADRGGSSVRRTYHRGTSTTGPS
jgi:hypothetical protein